MFLARCVCFFVFFLHWSLPCNGNSTVANGLLILHCSYSVLYQSLQILTRKTALISCVEKGSCAKDFSEVQVGMYLTGFVRNIMPYGVFVEFLHGLVGLVPISVSNTLFSFFFFQL